MAFVSDFPLKTTQEELSGTGIAWRVRATRDMYVPCLLSHVAELSKRTYYRSQSENTRFIYSKRIMSSEY